MLAVVFIAIVVTLFLVWPVFMTYRRQQQGFAAAVEAITDDPPVRSSTNPLTTDELVPGGGSDRARARRKLQEAELESIAISGRLDVALRARDARADFASGELFAAETALANIDAILREVVALGRLNHSIPRFEGLKHELPTSLSFELVRMPATPYALQDALDERQTEAVLAQLRVAQTRAQELERFRRQLVDELGAS